MLDGVGHADERRRSSGVHAFNHYDEVDVYTRERILFGIPAK